MDGRRGSNLMEDGVMDEAKVASKILADTSTYDMRHLPVGRVSIICKDHPEWGKWGVSYDHGGWYDIINSYGSRTLDKWEAEKFWEVAGSKTATDYFGTKTDVAGMQKEYTVRYNTILLKWKTLTQLIEGHKKQFLASPDFGYVGDLGHVNQQLDEVIRFLGDG